MFSFLLLSLKWVTLTLYKDKVNNNWMLNTTIYPVRHEYNFKPFHLQFNSIDYFLSLSPLQLVLLIFHTHSHCTIAAHKHYSFLPLPLSHFQLNTSRESPAYRDNEMCACAPLINCLSHSTHLSSSCAVAWAWNCLNSPFIYSFKVNYRHV